VPSTSAVLVMVIDCTLTGAPPPTGTLPTMIWRVGRRLTVIDCYRPAMSSQNEPMTTVKRMIRGTTKIGITLAMSTR
jgi:hypothetical protein